MSPHVVVVGSLHFDVLVSSDRLPMIGETLPGSGWLTKCGGKGGNQAVEAARHGARTSMVGCVGDDIFGERLRAHLSRADVDVSAVRTVPGQSGMSVVVAERSGDYAAIIASGANQELGAEQIEAGLACVGPDTVLVLQNEIPETANETVARTARARGATVLLNAAPARHLTEALGSAIDILVVNAIEAEMLGSRTVNDLRSAAEAARELARPGTAVIVTAGGHGVAVHGERVRETLSAHRVPLISTHGAGDAFVGALAARLAHGDDLQSAIRYANAAAAALVMTPEPERASLRADATLALLS